MHIAQLMPLPLTVSCFSKIQIGFTFLVPAHPGSPGQRAVKRVSVCVCVYGRWQRHSCHVTASTSGSRCLRGATTHSVCSHRTRPASVSRVRRRETFVRRRPTCRTSTPGSAASQPPDVPHINPRGVCTRNVRPRTLVITWQVNPSLRSRAPSAALMPTEARGNYLPERPYLRYTKTYHSHQPLESIRHAGNYFVPLSIRPIFIFCCRSYVNLLDY